MNLHFHLFSKEKTIYMKVTTFYSFIQMFTSSLILCLMKIKLNKTYCHTFSLGLEHSAYSRYSQNDIFNASELVPML